MGREGGTWRWEGVCQRGVSQTLLCGGGGGESPTKMDVQICTWMVERARVRERERERDILYIYIYIYVASAAHILLNNANFPQFYSKNGSK